MWRRTFFGLVCLATFVLPLVVSAPEAHAATDECTITNYESTYKLENGTFDVLEKITVDCGALEGKHGIFRTLQNSVSKPAAHETPVKLKKITDESGKPYKYEQSEENNTTTWKIGDPNTLITGVHQYWLSYTIGRVVGSAANNQSEIYWDILGTYWKLPINSFKATFTFPSVISGANTAPQLFDGAEGSESNTLSNFQWFKDAAGQETLVVASNKNMEPGQGITLSVMFPADLIPADQLTDREKFGVYFWFLLPTLGFIIGFILWRKFGRDPKLNKPEMVQYEPPLKLLPLELGLVESYGTLSNQYVTATIIDLAVRGFLKIAIKEGKIAMFGHDWELTLMKDDVSSLKPYEVTILNHLFPEVKTGAICRLSDQKNSFYKALVPVGTKAKAGLENLKLFDKSTTKAILLQVIIFLAIFGLGALLYFTKSLGETWQPAVSLVITGVIGMTFAILMRRRTPAGAEVLWQLRGFQLYLGKAEKYRMEFYEKEGIFEKYLPYAIAFGLTKQWLKRMHDVYQARGQNMTVWPWYVGSTHSLNSFNSFTDSIDSMISSFSNTVGSSPSSSSSGGGGFSGGGGGGGGGGSW